ncbi:hypothetical protein D3C72_1964390 [compost metagenome]
MHDVAALNEDGQLVRVGAEVRAGAGDVIAQQLRLLHGSGLGLVAWGIRVARKGAICSDDVAE